MSDLITLAGIVGTTPNHVTTGTGMPMTTFRLASTQRRYDRTKQEWVDGDTNWFTIVSFRQLAINVSASVDRGQRLVVTGRLQIRDWNTGEKSGTNVEIVAESVGHDLAWGTSAFTRVLQSANAQRSDDAAPEPAGWAAPGTSQMAGADAPDAAGADDELESAGATPF